jgi:hypothetical protein
VLPPRCELCGRKARLGGGRPFGGYSLVQFSDHTPHETGGLSEGLGWFCPTHAGAARRFMDLPRREALTRLRAEYVTAVTTSRRRRWLRRRA